MGFAKKAFMRKSRRCNFTLLSRAPEGVGDLRCRPSYAARTRYDKTDASFAAAVYFVAAFLALK